MLLLPSLNPQKSIPACPRAGNSLLCARTQGGNLQLPDNPKRSLPAPATTLYMEGNSLCFRNASKKFGSKQEFWGDAECVSPWERHGAACPNAWLLGINIIGSVELGWGRAGTPLTTAPTAVSPLLPLLK